jgi:hypothetical protein
MSKHCILRFDGFLQKHTVFGPYASKKVAKVAVAVLKARDVGNELRGMHYSTEKMKNI